MLALQEIGIRLIQSIQALSPALDGSMSFISFLGTIEFYLIIIPALYWLVDPRLAFRFLLILIAGDFVGSSLKLFWHQPRPYWLGSVKGIGSDAYYGLPSTHALNSMGGWGFLATKWRNSLFAAFATILIILIGYSRLYLGVHFPHDVLLGWLLGAGLLYLFIKYDKNISDRLAGLTLNKQILAAFFVSLDIIVIGLIIRALVGSTPDPASWASFSTEARNLSNYFTLAGALFGAGAGYALMRQSATVLLDGNPGKKLFSYFLGMIILLAIWQGLDILFAALAEDESLLGYVLRYVRYAATTLWATYWAPKFFARFGMGTVKD
jgi:membrane-associated phospholipid phosphatase